MFLIGNTIDRLKNKYYPMSKLVKSKKGIRKATDKANIVMGLSASY